jgi:hypothetical protein
MTSKKFGLYNLYCYGNENVQISDNLSYLGKFTITLPLVGVAKLVIDRAYIKSPPEHSTPSFTRTGEITIELNSQVSEEHFQVAKDVCILISLAMNGLIECRKISNANSIFTEGGSLSKGGWRGIVINRSGDDISDLVKSCWVRYRDLKQDRKLFEVIRLFIQQDEMTGQIFIEQNFALTAVLLENLKHTFALSSDKFKQKKDNFYIGKQRQTFNDLLKSMISEIKMPAELEDDLPKMVKDRNAILHKGLFDGTFGEIRLKHDKMKNFIRVYSLCLLNFEGRYSPVR